MDIFKENYCRICFEFFCCKSCRLKHEVDVHGINPECNICIYGRAFFAKSTSDSLLQHYQKAHWPLHCLLCKTVFISTEDLIIHSVCMVRQTPCNQENLNNFLTMTEENYDSPPIIATMHKSILTSSNNYYNDQQERGWLTTSTPMQKCNERELLQHIPEVITPVDYSENISNRVKSVNASSINSVTSEQSKDAEPSLKRRVTFSDIEIINIETPYHNRKHNYIPEYEINSHLTQQQFFQTPVYESANQNVNGVEGKSQMYVTAYEEVVALVADTSKVLNAQENNNICINQNFGTTNDDTDWESALMDSNLFTTDVLSATADPNFTASLLNAIQSDILPPVLNENLTETDDILSHIMVMDNKLPSSDIFSIPIDQNLISATKNSLIMNSQSEDLIEQNFPDLFSSQDYNLTQPETNFKILLPTPTEETSSYPIQESNKENEQEDSESSEENCGISGTSQKSGIWSSMANIFKTVVQGLSSSSGRENDATNDSLKIKFTKLNKRNSFKRLKPELDTSISESPLRKRIKLNHIQCRKTIRNVRPFFELECGKKNYQTNDQGTQTD